MGYVRHNENPCDIRTIDCTVRALAALLNEGWDSVYVQLCLMGYEMCDMPSSKAVINRFLRYKGFRCSAIPNNCPDCYTVRDFTEDHPLGGYLVATDSHVIPVIDGDYIDTWDSGNEIPVLFWTREGE